VNTQSIVAIKITRHDSSQNQHRHESNQQSACGEWDEWDKYRREAFFSRLLSPHWIKLRKHFIGPIINSFFLREPHTAKKQDADDMPFKVCSTF
jgi:hypothetical protein